MIRHRACDSAATNVANVVGVGMVLLLFWNSHSSGFAAWSCRTFAPLALIQMRILLLAKLLDAMLGLFLQLRWTGACPSAINPSNILLEVLEWNIVIDHMLKLAVGIGYKFLGISVSVAHIHCANSAYEFLPICLGQKYRHIYYKLCASMLRIVSPM